MTDFAGRILVVAKYDNGHGPLDVGALAGHVHHSASFSPRIQSVPL